MSSEIKMIILTSNEEVIRQFSSNKIKDTYIIPLQDDKRIFINEDDQNIIKKLSFLEQISEPSCHDDHMYKRALDSTDDHNQPKSVKISKKSSDFICAICGAEALGFNYDVLTCGSCKVFFRRNAHQDLEKLVCVNGDGQCSVSYGILHRCRKCRLERCLTMGMRRDFIVTDQQKQRRKQRLEENRSLASKHFSTNDSNSTKPTTTSNDRSIEQLLREMENDGSAEDDEHGNIQLETNELLDERVRSLPVDDWLTIECIRLSFLTTFDVPQFQCTDVIDLSNHATALITYAQFVDQIALRFINFFRQIDHFEQLNLADRLILIKYNIFPLFLTLKCFHYNPLNDCCSPGTNEEAMKHRRFFILCNSSMSLRDVLVKMVLSLVDVTQQDPIIISLLFIILIFSRGLSMNENEPILKESLQVYQAQSFYTKVLWNYLLSQAEEGEAVKRLTRLLTMIFRIQSVANQIREFFCQQYSITSTADKITPIMQSVLHIS